MAAQVSKVANFVLLLYHIRRIIKYLSREVSETLINAYVTSQLDYCINLLYVFAHLSCSAPACAKQCKQTYLELLPPPRHPFQTPQVACYIPHPIRNANQNTQHINKYYDHPTHFSYKILPSKLQKLWAAVRSLKLLLLNGIF